jgi:hypothetical protein
MHRFFVSDVHCYRRCEQSLERQQVVTVSGVDPVTSNLNLYTGVVEAIQDSGSSTPGGRRWLVTLEE